MRIGLRWRMRKILALTAIVAVLCVASPAGAAKKPTLPKVCTDALRKADVLAQVQLETARAGAKLSVVSAPYLFKGTPADPQTFLAALTEVRNAQDDLTAMLHSGDAARDAYARAAKKCRAATR